MVGLRERNIQNVANSFSLAIVVSSVAQLLNGCSRLLRLRSGAAKAPMSCSSSDADDEAES
eukprot:14489688-Alexandrium_andersonii.AAC.1